MRSVAYFLIIISMVFVVLWSLSSNSFLPVSLLFGGLGGFLLWKSEQKKISVPEKVESGESAKKEFHQFETNLYSSFGTVEGGMIGMFLIDMVPEGKDYIFVDIAKGSNEAYLQNKTEGMGHVLAVVLTMIDLFKNDKLSDRQKDVMAQYAPVIIEILKKYQLDPDKKSA